MRSLPRGLQCRREKTLRDGIRVEIGKRVRDLAVPKCGQISKM